MARLLNRPLTGERSVLLTPGYAVRSPRGFGYRCSDFGDSHLSAENEVTSLGGPVERVDGRLVLHIPLAAGGSALINCSRGIGRVEEDMLIVTIPDWLAEQLGITEGSAVIVDNRNGKFNITPAEAA